MISLPDAFLPEQVPIESYGNGGFRFGLVLNRYTHQGSLLSMPGLMAAFPNTSPEALTPEQLALLVARRLSYDILLMGLGERLVFPPPALRQYLHEQGLAPEMMSTAAAVRTYNILLGEKRRVAALFLAVDDAERA